MYHFFRFLVRFALKFLYRNINIVGIENVPKDKPVIMVANHPTAFMEPTILGCFQDKPLDYLVAARFFNHPVAGWFLKALHMIPVYAARDGLHILKKRQNMFDACFDALHNNHWIMIFSEATSKQVRYLRPLKKGFLRMGFGTMEKYDIKDVYILPVGNNFRAADQPRSSVTIALGEPINLADYWAEYQAHPKDTYEKLTQLMFDKLNRLVVAPTERTSDDAYELALNLIDNEINAPLSPVASDDAKSHKLTRLWADKIDSWSKTELSTWQQKAEKYFNQLASNNITDFGLVNVKKNTTPTLIALILGWLPAFLGRIFHLPIFLYARNFGQTKPKRIEFKLPAFFGIAFAGYFVMYIILIIIGFIVQTPWLWMGILTMPFLAYFAVLYYHFTTDYKAISAAKKLSSEKINTLTKLRAEIINEINQR